MMASDQLERYRAAIDDDTSGRKIEKIARDLRAKGIEVSAHDELKTAPKGYPKDHPRIELLRYRSAFVLREHGVPRWLHTPKAAERIAEDWRTARPLVEWLQAHVHTD